MLRAICKLYIYIRNLYFCGFFCLLSLFHRLYIFLCEMSDDCNSLLTGPDFIVLSLAEFGGLKMMIVFYDWSLFCFVL